MLKIEVQYNSRPMLVSLEASSPNETSEIAIAGDAPELFEFWLSNQRGAFGHLIGEATTPIDLHYAIASSGHQFTVLEGASLVERYSPGIPDEAMT